MSQTTARPRPRRQSGRSQFIDAAFLLALLFLTLFVTTFVLAEDDTATSQSDPKPISQLDISDAEKQQFEKLKDEGVVDDAAVTELVAANAPSDDKYSIAWGPLAGTVGLAVLYLGFVYSTSFREYREVVAARFGRGPDGDGDRDGDRDRDGDHGEDVA